jgi:hypothetical protein
LFAQKQIFSSEGGWRAEGQTEEGQRVNEQLNAARPRPTLFVFSLFRLGYASRILSLSAEFRKYADQQPADHKYQNGQHQNHP